MDRLSIGEDDNRQRHGDHRANRRDEPEGGDATDEQHAKDFFGRVRDRRERIGREHRQPRHPRQPFVVRMVRGNRRADEHAFQLGQEQSIGHDTPPIADGVS